MSIRQDKYQVGDVVKPDKTFHQYDFFVTNYGEGPFVVKHVLDLDEQVTYTRCGHAERPSLRSVGHTQWITIGDLPGTFSGAYFQPPVRRGR